MTRLGAGAVRALGTVTLALPAVSGADDSRSILSRLTTAGTWAARVITTLFLALVVVGLTGGAGAVFGSSLLGRLLVFGARSWR